MIRPPSFGSAPGQYEPSFFNGILRDLRAFIDRMNAPYPHNASTLNIDLDTLPTQADTADLRYGDVYRDASVSDVLRVWRAGGGAWSATPAGADKQIQFNDAGAFGADADFTWDKTNNILTAGSLSAGSGTVCAPSAAVAADADGAALYVAAGNGDTGGGGGTLALNGGTGGDTDASGGAVLITGGGGAGDIAGGVQIYGGTVTGTADVSGATIDLTGGNGTGTGNGGDIVMIPGAASGTGARGHVVLNGTGAALATNAAGGFVCVPSCAGTPTGTPANIPTGASPMVYDTSANKLWIHNGSWRGVVLT